jgi:cysteine-rich repeat protein
MARFALAIAWLLGAGCDLYTFPEDDLDDLDDGRPPPPITVCGDAVREGLEACDDGNRKDNDGCSASCRREARVHVTWRLATLAGEVQPCPDGFDVAEVLATPSTFVVPIKQRFDCAAGEGDLWIEVNDSLPPYDVWVLIKNGATDELYGLSAIDRVDVRGTELDTDHTIATDAGTITVGWSVWDGNQPRFCHGFVSSIDVVVRGEAGAPIAQSFTCDTLGVTQLLPTGTYRVEVAAVAGTRTATAAVDGVAVPTGGRTILQSVDLVFQEIL